MPEESLKTLGILSKKILEYVRRIQAKPENVDHMILAVCILHNFIRKYDVDTRPYEANTTVPKITEARLEYLPLQGGNITGDALTVRELYKD